MKSFQLLFMALVCTLCSSFIADSEYLTYTLNPKKQNIQLYWKDDKGTILGNFIELKKYVEHKNNTLLFAMNAGMYTKDLAPQGLYIQNFKTLKNIDTSSGSGNFYLKPNGVFYLMKNNDAKVCSTKDFIKNNDIRFATQSGPMLLINGNIHPAFIKGSSNLNIRNGVGILPDNTIVFVMSKTQVNFYDFASYFKKLGCKNALYLDGFVSRVYLPDQNWIQTDGNFGVMIGVTK